MAQTLAGDADRGGIDARQPATDVAERHREHRATLGEPDVCASRVDGRVFATREGKHGQGVFRR